MRLGQLVGLGQGLIPLPGRLWQRYLAQDPPKPRVPPGSGWKPDSEPRTERQKTTRVTSEGPVAHQSLWLFRTLELCHLGKIEHLYPAMVKRDLRTGVPMVSLVGLQLCISCSQSQMRRCTPEH